MAVSLAPFEPRVATVLGMGCVYVPVTDVHASAKWYADAFGLDVSPNTPLRPGMTHAILTYPPVGAGRPNLFLVGCEALPEKPRRKDGLEMLTFCLLVDDMPKVVARLRERGVRLESDVPLDRGTCGTNLRCYDPDGNKFEVVQPA